MMLALARFGGQPAVVLGQQRVVGGLVGPAALREARRGMALAAGLQLPLVLVIDTAGPALSAEAEQGGLAGEIARCLAELVTLDTPTVSVLLGQGSGGPALAMVPADRVLAALHGWLAPLPPEGASAIVFRDVDHAPELAAAQGIRSADLLRHGIVDAIVPERPDAADEPMEFTHRLSATIANDCTGCVRCPTTSGWRPGWRATGGSGCEHDAAVRAQSGGGPVDVEIHRGGVAGERFSVALCRT